MIEILSVIIACICLGALIYFRYTDSRNVAVQTLKDYVKQSEKHIESMLRRKEKEFGDRMIQSEVVIDRMRHLAQSLQEKLDTFDKDLDDGETLFKSLRHELANVNKELYEYRQIRSEFKDIEERVDNLLDIKQQAEDGSAEVALLREKVQIFEKDYVSVVEDLKVNSRNELETFFQQMQQDLSEYLTNARQQLADKDAEMTMQIQELGTASSAMTDSIKEFKAYAENSIDQLRQECENDLAIAKNASESNITDIYDMWEKIKEQTQQDADSIAHTLNYQKEFFDNAEQHIRAEIEQFTHNLNAFTEEIQEKINMDIHEKIHEIETKASSIYQELNEKGVQVKEELSVGLESQTSVVHDKLDRLYAAFSEQEQNIEEKMRSLNEKVNEDVYSAENHFQKSIAELQETLDHTKTYSDTILQQAEQKIQEQITLIEEEFKEKASLNMSRLEESLKEINQERVIQSVLEVTQNLEQEFKEKYQENVDDIFRKSEELEDIVKQKSLSVDELGSRLEKINETFNNEKEKIILMCTELDKDRENSTELIFEQVKEYMQELQNQLTVSIQSFLEDENQKFTNEQDIWKERFDDTIQEGRSEFNKIKQDIEGIHRFVENLEETALTDLKRAAERLSHDSEYRIDDLKKYITDLLRNSKEEFLTQTDLAKQEIKELRQELWSQEKEIHQLAEKDLERLNLKTKEIEKQFQNLMKKAERLDQIEELVRKINQQHSEINDLKKDLQQMNTQLKESYDKGQHTIVDLQKFKEQLEQKANELNIRSSEADRMQEMLVTTIKEASQEAGQLNQVFDLLKEEKEKAQFLEELLLKNLTIFNELQDSLDQLESKRALVENLQDSLKNSENSISMINSTSDEMDNRIQEMNTYSQDLQDKLLKLQTEMHELAGNQTEVKRAVSKLNDLEHIVIHIDEEMKRLEKMRDWIAKSLNNVERIGAKTGVTSLNIEQETADDSNVKNILRLYDKDWSMDDIAKNLKVSPAYVELIIERYRSS